MCFRDQLVFALAPHLEVEPERLRADVTDVGGDFEKVVETRCAAKVAFEVRARDRFYDFHVHVVMQKIIGDRLRPEGQRDKTGVDNARGALHTALGIAEKDMAARTWAAGEAFSMADCAAAPTLFYVNMAVTPLTGAYPNLAAYLGRLTTRPSYARALKEAEPFLKYVPM